MKTLLRLTLIAVSSVLGVGAAVFLAGPPEQPAVARPATLVVQAVAPPPAAEARPALELQLPTLKTGHEARAAQAALGEPPLPSSVAANALSNLLPVVAQSQPRVARQASTGSPALEELPTPKPDAPSLLLAQVPSLPSGIGLPTLPSDSGTGSSEPNGSGPSGSAAPGDMMSNMINNLMQNPDQLQQLLKITGMQNQTLGNLIKQLPSQGQAPASAPAPATAPAQAPAPVEALPAKTDDSATEEHKSTISHVPGTGDGADHLMINIQNEDIRSVLEALSEQGELNILPSANVQGDVSAVLKDVDVNAALDAILKSTGFVARREGKFIYVGTPADFDAMRMSLDTLGTRVFRPNYVTAKDLQALITPLLTAGVGKISVSAPSEIGIQSDANKAGGNSFPSNEALLVQDYEGVLLELEQVIREIDKRPMQVAIEAMILSVQLSDEYKFGINFEALQGTNNMRFGTGTPQTNPLDGTGQVNPTTGGQIGAFSFTTGGLNFAFLDGNLGAFINAVETIGDTNVIATPKLMCLNKQRAEILIGAQYGYVNSTVTQTFTTQSVQFLEVGAALRIRPFIGTDGMIRMEVHPELSTGQVVVQGNFTLPQKELTQVTTNIMCRDGCTVVIGGLMREDLEQSTTQVPLLGSLPYVGPLFRSIDEIVARREILVLVTPRIVYDAESAREAKEDGNTFIRRQQLVADHLSPFSRYDMSRRYTRRAETALKEGDTKKAARLLELALVFDPQNMHATKVRSDIEELAPPPAVRAGLAPPALPSPPPLGPDHAVNGEEVAPWMLDELQGKSSTPVVPIRPRRLGPTGGDLPEPAETKLP